MIKSRNGTKGGGEDKPSTESGIIKEVKKCFSKVVEKKKSNSTSYETRKFFFLFLKY